MSYLADFSWMPPSQTLGKLWIPALISIIFAGFGRAVRGVTPGGAVAGALVCFALLLGAGWQGFIALFVVFLLTWAATRIGYARKQSLGTAELRTGRTAAQVFANLGVAAICAGICAISWRDSRMLIALIAALAEAAADTVSSEIGQAVGGVPLLVTNWKPVPAGTDGAITLAGTAAGAAAAIVVGFASVVGSGLGFGWRSAPICAAAAIVGMIADSFLGATLERRGLLDNNAVNFSSTAIAAMIAFAMS
jgi:uncharacterized protein (TIGR00297 family)